MISEKSGGAWRPAGERDVRWTWGIIAEFAQWIACCGRLQSLFWICNAMDAGVRSVHGIATLVCYNESTRAAPCAPFSLSGTIIMTFRSPFRRHRFATGAALIVLLAAPLALVTGPVRAQTAASPAKPAAPAARPPVPSDAPPAPLEKLEEGQQPGITVRPSGPEKGSTDSRDNAGRVTETEVRTGSTTYYVRPNNQVGNAQPGDQQSSGNRAAQFKVKEFDLGRKNVPPKDDAPVPQVLEPAPAKN